MNVCSIDGCERKLQARGWCGTHYQRWRAHGDVMTDRVRLPKGTLCAAKDCDRPNSSFGYCGMHHRRVVKHGNPHTLGQSGRPLTGEHPGWDAIHKRIFRERGKATQYACVDCAGPAREWSYNGEDPNEITGTVGRFKLPYSLDLAHYEPRCTPCHRNFDNAIRYAQGRMPTNRGERAGGAKFTMAQVIAMRDQDSAGVPRSEIEKQFSISQSYLARIIKRETWRHV